MSEKRGDWSERCENCKHYEKGKCKDLQIKVNKKDWCKEYEPER